MLDNTLSVRFGGLCKDSVQNVRQRQEWSFVKYFGKTI